MVLLVALLCSTCYWQPVPIDSALSFPHGNATTFRDLMRANLSLTVDQDLPLPPFVQLLDRCLCDVVGWDIGAWEKMSAEQTLHDYEAAMQRVKKETVSAGGAEDAAVTPSSSQNANETSRPAPGTPAAHAHVEEPFSFRRLRNFVFPTPPASSKYRLVSVTSLPAQYSSLPSIATETSDAVRPSVVAGSQPIEAPSLTHSPYSPSIPSSTVLPLPDPALPLLRTFYDLRSYGLDVTFDFGWS